MLVYKKIDLGIQVSLVVLCVVFLLVNNYYDHNPTDLLNSKRPDITVPFFTLAAVQFTSLLVDYVKRKIHPPGSMRKTYTFLSLLAIVLVIFLFAGSSIKLLTLDGAIILGVFLLISTSFLAIFDIVICTIEIMLWKKEKVE